MNPAIFAWCRDKEIRAQGYRGPHLDALAGQVLV